MTEMAIDLTKNNNNYFSQSTGEKTGGVNTGAMLVQPDRHQVWEYAEELNSNVDPDKFFDYYDEKHWTIRGEPINDWKAVFRRWNETEFRRTPKKKTFSYRYGEQPVNSEDVEAFMHNDQEHLDKILAKLKKLGQQNAK